VASGQVKLRRNDRGKKIAAELTGHIEVAYGQYASSARILTASKHRKVERPTWN